MTENSQTRQVTRRQALRGAGALAAGAAASLAGCSAFGNPQPFKSVTAEGLYLIVQLSEDTQVATVNLSPPDSSDPVASDSVNAGQSKVEISLVRMVEGNHMPLSAGTYTLVAVGKDGNTLGEQTVELASDVAITDVGVARGSAVLNGDFAFTMTLTNSGNLPARVKSIGVPEGVPNPMRTQSSAFRGTLGTLHNTRTVPGWKQLMVGAGETVRYESLEEPFLLGQDFEKYTHSKSSAIYCNGKQRQATAVVWFVRGEKITQPFTYTMSGEATVASGISDRGGICSNITANVLNKSSGNQSS